MAEPGGAPGGEPLEMPGDFPGHLVGPYAPDGQVEVPLRPRGQTVVGLGGAPVGINYLS